MLQVVEEGAGKNEGADELLSAFNVATFKSAEDDKAFWNRLIPVDVRDAENEKQVRTCQHELPNNVDHTGACPQDVAKILLVQMIEQSRSAVSARLEADRAD